MKRQLQSNKSIRLPVRHERIFPFLGQAGFISVFLVLLGVVAVSIAFKAATINFSELLALPAPAEEAPVRPATSPVYEVDVKTLREGNYTRPYIVVVARLDGSYTYALVNQATVEDGAFVGGVQVTFLNGDYGLLTEKEGIFTDFVTKRGEKELVQIIKHLVMGIRLKDGRIVPAEFTQGTVVTSDLVGDFHLKAPLIQKEVFGQRTARGTFLSFDAEVLDVKTDAKTDAIIREILKLTYALASPSALRNVLGVTTVGQGSVLADQDAIEDALIPVDSSGIV